MHARTTDRNREPAWVCRRGRPRKQYQSAGRANGLSQGPALMYRSYQSSQCTAWRGGGKGNAVVSDCAKIQRGLAGSGLDLTLGLPSLVVLPSHCKPRCKLEMRKVTQHNDWFGHLRSVGQDRQGLRTSQFEEGGNGGLLVSGFSGEGEAGRQGLAFCPLSPRVPPLACWGQELCF